MKIVDLPMKTPAAGQVLIKVQACGMCLSDASVLNGHFPGVQYPIVPGHEVVGRIVALGPNVNEKWSVGGRVGAGWEGGHCHSCAPCRKGAQVMCTSTTKKFVNGAYGLDGGYAEYMVANQESLAIIPEDLDAAEAAPLLCAGVTTFNSLRNMNIKAGEVVAVQGIGGLGHLAIQFASKMGYRTVAISGGNSKRELALKLGAHDYIDASSENVVEKLNAMGGAMVIMATAPSAEAVEPLVNALALDGTLLLLAAFGDFKVNAITLLMKRASIRGWPSGSAIDSEETIKFASQFKVKTAVERFKLSEVEVAFEKLVKNSLRFRGVLMME